MTTPNIKKMTPIAASHLYLIKYNPKTTINKLKNINIINAITIPTPPFLNLVLSQIEDVVNQKHC